MHHAFLYISLPSLHDYNVKVPNFTFCRGHENKTTINFSLFPNLSTVFYTRKICQHLTNWKSWIGISAIKSEVARITGLQVTSRRPCWWSKTKAYLSSGNLTPFSCKFFEQNFYCIDPQHGRLVTWLQTKNSLFKWRFRSRRRRCCWISLLIKTYVLCVFTWRHRNHICVPNLSCGSWTLLLCRRFLLFQ